MEILVFRTNIESERKVNYLESTLNLNYDILKWSVDYEDIDNVLRVETTRNLKEEDIIGLVEKEGFRIEALPD